jgi:hypothetical protein
MISLLSNLSSLWMTRANRSLLANSDAHNSLGLHPLHAQEIGDRTDAGMGRAGRPKPTSDRFGRPFLHVGPLAILHLVPFSCIISAMSFSRPR